MHRNPTTDIILDKLNGLSSNYSELLNTKDKKVQPTTSSLRLAEIYLLKYLLGENCLEEAFNYLIFYIKNAPKKDPEREKALAYNEFIMSESLIPESQSGKKKNSKENLKRVFYTGQLCFEITNNLPIKDKDFLFYKEARFYLSQFIALLVDTEYTDALIEITQEQNIIKSNFDEMNDINTVRDLFEKVIFDKRLSLTPEKMTIASLHLANFYLEINHHVNKEKILINYVNVITNDPEHQIVLNNNFKKFIFDKIDNKDGLLKLVIDRIALLPLTKQEELLNYYLSGSSKKREEALKEDVHVIRAFFWTQTGANSCKLGKGTLLKIHTKLEAVRVAMYIKAFVNNNQTELDRLAHVEKYPNLCNYILDAMYTQSFNEAEQTLILQAFHNKDTILGRLSNKAKLEVQKQFANQIIIEKYIHALIAKDKNESDRLEKDIGKMTGRFLLTYLNKVRLTLSLPDQAYILGLCNDQTTVLGRKLHEYTFPGKALEEVQIELTETRAKALVNNNANITEGPQEQKLNIEMAIQCYTNDLNSNPDIIPADEIQQLCDRGILHYKLGDYKSALTDYITAIIQAPIAEIAQVNEQMCIGWETILGEVSNCNQVLVNTILDVMKKQPLAVQENFWLYCTQKKDPKYKKDPTHIHFGSHNPMMDEHPLKERIGLILILDQPNRNLIINNIKEIRVALYLRAIIDGNNNELARLGPFINDMSKNSLWKRMMKVMPNLKPEEQDFVIAECDKKETLLGKRFHDRNRLDPKLLQRYGIFVADKNIGDAQMVPVIRPPSYSASD